MTESEQEKKNKRTAMITTIGINTAILLLLFLVAGWKAPNPPNPEYGIELNFGTDDTGSGDVQPTEPVGTKESVVEENQQPEQPQEKAPEISESQPEQVAAPEPEVTSKIESPVVVKEEKKVEPKPAEVEKKVEKPVEKKVEPKTDPVAAYKSPSSTSSSNKSGTAQGEGNDPGKTGDKGSPQGTQDANAYFGKPGGGGGGFGLDMAGWEWDQTPKAPAVADDHAGKVVFEIEVDSEGEIIRIDPIEVTLSPETVRLCKQEIQKRSLVRKSGGIIPERSKGRVVFELIIK